MISTTFHSKLILFIFFVVLVLCGVIYVHEADFHYFIVFDEIIFASKDELNLRDDILVFVGFGTFKEVVF